LLSYYARHLNGLEQQLNRKSPLGENHWAESRGEEKGPMEIKSSPTVPHRGLTGRLQIIHQLRRGIRGVEGVRVSGIRGDFSKASGRLRFFHQHFRDEVKAGSCGRTRSRGVGGIKHVRMWGTEVEVFFGTKRFPKTRRWRKWQGTGRATGVATRRGKTN